MHPLLRSLRPLLLLAALAASALAAPTEWKVTTWNLEWFPAGAPDVRDEKVEQRRTKEAAEVLRTLDPDIVLLQEVRDEAAVEALAKEIGRGHQVVVVSRFRFGDELSQHQQAILAKFPARAAFWKAWTTRQAVTPVRGYAFALFDTPSGAPVAVYSLHLKSNVVSRNAPDLERAASLNVLQRELAILQLTEHLSDISKDPQLAPAAAIVGGDFNTDPFQNRFAKERTIPALLSIGFTNPITRLPEGQRATLPGSGRFPPAVFDHVLLLQAEATADPVVTKTEVSDHRPVTVTVRVP